MVRYGKREREICLVSNCHKLHTNTRTDGGIAVMAKNWGYCTVLVQFVAMCMRKVHRNYIDATLLEVITRVKTLNPRKTGVCE